MVDVPATIASCSIMLKWREKHDHWRPLDKPHVTCVWDIKDLVAARHEDFPCQSAINVTSMARQAGSSSATAPFSHTQAMLANTWWMMLLLYTGMLVPEVLASTGGNDCHNREKNEKY